jgi:hypothetical protein
LKRRALIEGIHIFVSFVNCVHSLLQVTSFCMFFNREFAIGKYCYYFMVGVHFMRQVFYFWMWVVWWMWIMMWRLSRCSEKNLRRSKLLYESYNFGEVMHIFFCLLDIIHVFFMRAHGLALCLHPTFSKFSSIVYEGLGWTHWLGSFENDGNLWAVWNRAENYFTNSSFVCLRYSIF